jgi:hypothetical protein
LANLTSFSLKWLGGAAGGGRTFPALETELGGAFALEARLGLGRIVALYYRSSISYQIR